MKEKESLSWDELAKAYDKYCGGRRARTLPMEEVFDWAEKRKDLFRVDEAGFIYYLA